MYVMPMVEIMPHFLPYLTDEEFLVTTSVELFMEGKLIEDIISYHFFTMAGGVVLPLLISFWMWSQSMKLGKWMSKRIHYNQTLNLFWNGVPLKKTKLGVRLSKPIKIKNVK